MNRDNFNVVAGNMEQELVKGIAFVRTRRAPENVANMLSAMNLVTVPITVSHAEEFGC